MNNVNINLKALNFPDKPGVYLMKDRQNKIIYIGKAKNLRKRINSYFTGSPSPKTNFLVKNIKNIETIITKTEQEALLLENNLIKKWKPKYNIDLKDGKTYPVIRITNEEYPRIFRTRRIIFDGSVYYGPFPSAHQIDTYLKLIDRMFPLRKCRGSLKKKRAHPCLNYYIGRCFSPCTGRISKDEYREMVGKIKSLLSGKASELIRDTRERMLKASRSLNFEEAAVFRDNLSSIKFIMDQQHIIDFSKLSGDYIGYCSSEHIFTFVILQMRDGKLIGREIFNSESYAETEETFLHFIFQYYTEAQNIPSIVYIPELTDSRQATLLSKQLKSSLSGKKLRFIIPKRGKHLQTLKMALENADEYLTSRLSMY
ncbi:MAG: excinuclease ABC subunit C, partial [Spirochaetales bacterium]|nr:excinuclease ABC subunit C [Spirochaetales bacterium]